MSQRNQQVGICILIGGSKVAYGQRIAGKVSRKARRRIHHERGPAYNEGIGRGDGGNGTGQHILVERLFVRALHRKLDAAAARRGTQARPRHPSCSREHPTRRYRPRRTTGKCCDGPIRAAQTLAVSRPSDAGRRYFASLRRRACRRALQLGQLGVAAVGLSVKRDHLGAVKSKNSAGCAS